MVKRTAVILTALMAALIGAVTPAQANAGQFTRTACVTFDGGNVKTCLHAGWSPQADGTGVRLEHVYVQTTGCGYLEDDNPYGDTVLRWRNPNTGLLNYRWDWPNRQCAWTLDMSDAGKDKGVMEVGISSKARVDNGGDRWVILAIQVEPDGGSKITEQTTLPA